MQESRMSQEEARYFFRLADTSKKGYLDLADVYHLVGNVSEQELFSIFRSLDVSKTGQVRLPDLETCLGDPSISRSTLEAGYVFACFARFIDCLKAKLQIQIQLRARFCFCRSLLSAIYRTFKETVGKEVLCCADVAKLLGQDRKGAGTLQFADIEGELRCLLGEKPLTEDTLIDIFISQQEWATRES